MCGIAGYNVSPSFAETYITREIQEQILQEAWLHNIHRGYDAAGYFAVSKEKNDKTLCWKKAGIASKLFKDHFLGKEKIPASYVFGAHTRDPSGKSAPVDVANNNHPVYWNGVFVTHNGTLKNPDKIKNRYKLKQVIPAVDSVAIPMVLSECDPFDMEQVGEALARLEGAFAIHAVWKAHPGVSLLARGTGRPLIVITHPDIGIFYSSEEDAAWNMIRVTGLDPNDNNFKWYDLKDNVMILFENGEPVYWSCFVNLLPNNSKLRTTRLLPPEDDRKEVVNVYQATLQHDFGNKATHRSLRGVPEKEVTLVYDRRSRENVESTYPTENDIKLPAIWSEASKVWKTKDGYYHIFLGPIEIVVTEHRVVKEIYNHDLFNNEDRWYVESSEDLRKLFGHTLGFEKFLKAKSDDPKDIPTEIRPYWYELEAQRTALLPFSGVYGENYASYSEQWVETDDNKRRKELAFIEPSILLTWENMGEHLEWHKDDNSLAFVVDATCGLHAVKFSDHVDPHLCEKLLYSAAYTLACLGEVDGFMGIHFESYPIEWDMKKKDCNHKWRATEYVEVFALNGRYDITTENTCMRCASRKKLAKLPSWFRMIDHTNRINIPLSSYDKELEIVYAY